MTIEPHFPTVFVEYFLAVDGLAGGSADADRLIGVKLPGAFAADDQITIALIAQPIDVGVGGDAGIHYHERARRHLELVEHRLQGTRFGDIAGKGLRGAYKAAAVDDQAKRN